MLILFSIILLQLISLTLGAATISPFIQARESDIAFLRRLNESVFRQENMKIDESVITKSGPESESGSSFNIGSSANFAIPVSPASLLNYSQSKTTNKENNGNEDNVIKESDLADDLLKWEAPLWFQKSVPYYLAGYDEEGRPVWAGEWGKYPLRELTLLEGDEAKIFEKYLKQLAARILKSIPDHQNTTENEVKVFAIVDLDELDFFKISHPRSISVILKWFASFQHLIVNHLDTCMVINVSYVASTVINLLRPILGKAVENMEFYGTNAAKWKPQLIRRLPKEILPSWYGGSADFKPVKVYG